MPRLSPSKETQAQWTRETCGVFLLGNTIQESWVSESGSYVCQVCWLGSCTPGHMGLESLLITMMGPCSEQPQGWCRVPLWCVLVIHFLILCLSLPISSMAIVTVQIYHTTLLEGHPLSGHACWKWSPEVIFPPRATSYSPPFFSRS